MGSFHKLLVLAVLMTTVVVTKSAVSCPSQCTCISGAIVSAECDHAGLTRPPSGDYPHISKLILRFNDIADIEPDYFLGFPNLIQLFLENNLMTELDMNDFTGLKKLEFLRVDRNNIQNVIPLDPDKQIPNLESLFLNYNKITSLPRNLLNGLPKFQFIDVDDNPLVLPGDAPIFSSNTIETLFFNGVDATGITSDTFSKLPNVSHARFERAKFAEVGDAFSRLTKLSALHLEDSDLKAIRRGAFSKDQSIFLIDLSDSQIQTIETAALDGILESQLYIPNTPLACQCLYEALYMWAVPRNIRIEASCGSQPPCYFIT